MDDGDINNSTSAPSSNSTDTGGGNGLVQSNDSEIIRSSLRLYGSIYVAFFLMFCFVRRRFPKLYNLRSWVETNKCDLATSLSQRYGFLSWAWIVFQVDDDALLHNCGMDAVAFLRCLRLGAKLSAVGMFNAMYLIPIYLTASDEIDDNFVRMTAGNLPIGSNRFAAVVVATYIVVLGSLHLITKEYKWYTQMRHKFLSLDQESNYAVYVAGIPEEFRSDFALCDFFGGDEFVAANITMDIPKLEAKVARRKTLVRKLEHAIAEEKMKGIVKTHRTFKLQNARAKNMPLSESVETVQTYRQQLDELNIEISRAIGRIRNQNHRLRRHMSKANASNDLLRGRALTLDEDINRPPSTREIVLEESDSEDQIEVAGDDPGEPNAFMKSAWSPIDISTSDTIDFHAAADLPEEGTRMEGLHDVEMGKIEESKSFEPPESKLIDSKLTICDFDATSGDDQESQKVYQSTVPERFEKDVDGSGTNELTEKLTERTQLSSTTNVLPPSNPLSTVTKRASMAVQRASGSLTKRTCNSVDTIAGGVKKATDLGVYGSKKVRDLGISGAQMAADGAKKTAIKGIQRAQTSFVENAAAIAPILRSKGEGAPRDAGFVVFEGLYLTQAALQMLQHRDGTKMLVEEAPSPDQIYWRNVGLPMNSKRTGGILALAATGTLCLFWSIPVAFISSLTEVNSLKETMPRLGSLMERMPALEHLIAVLAPLLLLGLNEGILPIILKYFSTWEGHISSPRLEASLFKKLAAFAIVQTFFVSTVSGSITSELANMIDQPENIALFLGNSLPAQSSYFIQIVFVFTFFIQGLELLRVVPLSYAFARRFVGPRLTEKERKRKWFFIHPLEDPPPFYLADFFAQIILFYVIFFVYSSTSPITCVFLFGCFLILECGYRYHFIHNFKNEADSGGRIWKGFINLLMSSVVIGQLTLIGLLLLNQAFYSVPALAPLLAITVFYWSLVHPKRMRVADRLPSVQARELDRNNRSSGRLTSSHFEKLRDVYLQPALQQPTLLPDTDDDDE